MTYVLSSSSAGSALTVIANRAPAATVTTMATTDAAMSTPSRPAIAYMSVADVTAAHTAASATPRGVRKQATDMDAMPIAVLTKI